MPSDQNPFESSQQLRVISSMIHLCIRPYINNFHNAYMLYSMKMIDKGKNVSSYFELGEPYQQTIWDISFVSSPSSF